ncbi:MAG: acetyl-CoA carboxylase, biotin carboxyl carrier protein [Sphingobium sp.]
MSGQSLRDLERLAGLFTAGGWSELRIESDGLSLLLASDTAVHSLGGDMPPVPVTPPPSPDPAARPPARGDAAPSSAPLGVEGRGIDPSWHAVAAPNLGTFYRSPKPGAAPFVEVGQHVDPGTEICLIEVMKLFTSVTSGVAGTVRHIAVADAELVEGGQALIYIERD